MDPWVLNLNGHRHRGRDEAARREAGGFAARCAIGATPAAAPVAIATARGRAYLKRVISPPAPSARLGAAPVASRPGKRLAAVAAGLGLAVLGLVALAVFGLGASSLDTPASAAAFRPALAVVAPHTAPVEAPRMHRLDWDGPAVAAADGEITADPALPIPAAQPVPVPGFVPAPFREGRAARPTPAPVASPLRPPRAA